MTLPTASENLNTIIPRFEIPLTAKAIAAAFWAYAGFENLTFMAGDFKKPDRDLIASIVVALVTCGSMYLLISICYAALVPLNEVKMTLSIYQLSEFSTKTKYRHINNRYICSACC